MNFDAGPFPVVQTGTAQFGVFQFKSQRTDQVQVGAGVGAQSDDVAGVGRYFRLVEDDVEQGVTPE